MVVTSGRARVRYTHRDVVCRTQLGSYFKGERFWKFTQSCLPPLVFITNVTIKATTTQCAVTEWMEKNCNLQSVQHINLPDELNLHLQQRCIQYITPNVLLKKCIPKSEHYDGENYTACENSCMSPCETLSHLRKLPSYHLGNLGLASETILRNIPPPTLRH